MTGAPVDDVVAAWRSLSPADRADLLDELGPEELYVLDAALGPDPAAIGRARQDTADPVAWIRTFLPALMPLEPGPHHEALASSLEVDRPTGTRLVVGAPRGSGKSTTALSALPILAAVRRSHRFVVVIRDNLPDAVSSVRGIRALLESSPTLTEAYPWVAPMPGEAGELHLSGGVVILARSTGSGIRGLNRTLIDGSIVRPDLVVGDDLEDDASARSQLQTGRLEEWLLGTVGQLGGPPGSGDASLDLVVVGTTLETNALVSRMLSGSGPFASWDRRRFPAEATVADLGEGLVAIDAEQTPTAIPVPAGAEAGDRIALWPDGIPLAYLDRLSDPEDELFVGSILYAREYLLRPRQRTDVLFAADRTVWVDGLAADWLEGTLGRERDAMGADPAVSVREVADYTALVVTALHVDPDTKRPVVVVPYAERRRATPGELLEWIEETATTWIPSGRVAFEAEGGFAWAADEIRRRGNVSVRPVTSGGADKRTRAVPLSVWHEGGRLWLDAGLRGTPFDLEVHGFTGTGTEEHDDYVDALVYGATYSTNAWRRR